MVFVFSSNGFVSGGELTNCPPGTAVKFITKSRSLELLPGRPDSYRVPFAGFKAWICNADECFNEMPKNAIKAVCLLKCIACMSIERCMLKSNINRAVQVRFCKYVGVKFPCDIRLAAYDLV